MEKKLFYLINIKLARFHLISGQTNKIFIFHMQIFHNLKHFIIIFEFKIIVTLSPQYARDVCHKQQIFSTF
jgi:hypothetical protein